MAIIKRILSKQYLKLTQDDQYTLLQNTFKRISNLKSIDSPIFITNEEHRFIIAEQIRQIGLEKKSIILEPVGRNTAAAIAIAAIESMKDGSDPNLLVLSSDHFISDNLNFIKAIKSALNDSEKGKLVTFGVIPKSAETGYGYVEFSKKKILILSKLWMF